MDNLPDPPKTERDSLSPDSGVGPPTPGGASGTLPGAGHDPALAVTRTAEPPADPAIPEPAMPEPAMYTLDPRFVRAEQVGNLIFTAVLATGAVVWLAIRWWIWGLDLFFYGLATVSFLVVAASLWFGIYWPGKTFRHTRWRVDDSGLEIRKGVLWRHRIAVPMNRVQHADVSQGPLQRAFDLGSLTVHTAGTSSASVELPGLNHDVAIQVRDEIVRARRHAHVS